MGEVVRFMKGRTHEDQVTHGELSRWGFWCGIQYAADGYSPINTLKLIFSGRGNNPGHRVLCIDPPTRTRFWEINANILMMRREFYEVLVARYALPCKPSTGHPYYASELAGFLGITPELYLERLARATRGYKSIIFPDLVLSQATC
jgi:hypothetical protein